jgi:putative hydrolase of the HAD superfamily
MLWRRSQRPERPFHASRLEAVIFDVDGTLYRQDSLRAGMIKRLIRAHLTSPRLGMRTFQILRAYRKEQEHLRTLTHSGNVADLQLQQVCEQTGHDVNTVRSCVERWMENEPLELLPSALHPCLVDFLDFVSGRGLLLAVFSDYPAVRKLQAMGIENYFQVVVSAQDLDVQEFKPSPRGLEVTLQRLGVEPSQAVYIGDRPEVDGEAARRAGMRCVIVGRSRYARHAEWMGVRNFAELKTRLFD